MTAPERAGAVFAYAAPPPSVAPGSEAEMRALLDVAAKTTLVRETSLLDRIRSAHKRAQHPTARVGQADRFVHRLCVCVCV